MRKTALSSLEFNESKETAIKYEPKSIRINLSDIEVNKDSFELNIIEVKGQTVAVSNEVLSKFLEHVGISKKLKSSFTENPNVIADIVNVLNSLKRKSCDLELKLLISHENEVIDMTKNDKGRMSNKNFFAVAESIVNKYGLDVIESNVQNNGVSEICLLNPKSVAILGLDEEIHKFGIRLTNKLSDTEINNFAYRLVCTNGNTILDEFSRFALGSVAPSEIERLFTHIQRMRMNGFIPTEFELLVKKAQNTTASLTEVENGIKSIISKIKMPLGMIKEETDIFISKFINTHFTQYMIRKQELLAKGFDIEKLSPSQKSYIKCESSSFGRITVWDLVNKLTFFGSNDNGNNFNQPQSLQIEGGKLLSIGSAKNKNGFDLADEKILFLGL
jgi:hypothetical protein